MTQISRTPVWTVVVAGIDRDELDPDLNEASAAAHTLGPLLYQCLFDKTPIASADVQRSADAFLTAFRIERPVIPVSLDGKDRP